MTAGKKLTDSLTKSDAFFRTTKTINLKHNLLLTELVSTVTYNASEQPVPFDSDSGHYIASFALKATEHFDDKRLEEEVKSAILLFSRNKSSKTT